MHGKNRKNSDFTVYTDHFSTRIEYTFDFVFRCVLGINFSICSIAEMRGIPQQAHLIYTKDTSYQSKPYFLASGILHQGKGEKNYNNLKICDYQKIENQSYCMSQKEGYDPFGLIFFMLSRMEEYLNDKTDIHGRFPASSSLAHNENLITTPLTDHAVLFIRSVLNRFYPNVFPLVPLPYKSLATYDIDYARAYLWKGKLRFIGGLGKELLAGRWISARERIQVALGKKRDPFDEFDFMEQVDSSSKSLPVYFWLLGKPGEFDKNSDVKHTEFRSLIKTISSKYPVGIHPSYASFLNRERIKEEIGILEEITGKKISRNRFHFLRFKLPESYRLLLELGITEDFSMAYADAIGFRAGTSYPFHWYDLDREEITGLKVHPFQIMEITLRNYLGLDLKSSEEAAGEILERVKNTGGCFTTLWHNSSFGEEEWKGWKNFYKRLRKRMES